MARHVSHGLALAIASATLFSGCTTTHSNPSLAPAAPTAGTREANDGTAADRFDRLVRGYFQRRFALAPVEATEEGVHEHDMELDDLTPAGVERYESFLDQTRRALDTLLPELPDSDLPRGPEAPADRSDHPRLDAEILRDAIALEYTRLHDWDELATHPETFHSLASSAVYEPMVRDYAPRETRVRSITARLRLIPAMLRAGESWLDPSVSGRARPPRLAVETALLDLAGVLEMVTQTFPEFADACSDEGLKREARAAAQEAAHALEAHRRFLTETVLPHADGDYHDGRARWMERARLGEGVTDTPEAIRDAAQHEVQRLQGEMRALAQRLGHPGEDFHATMARLSAQHPSAQGLIDAYRTRLDRLRGFVLEHHLATIDPARDHIQVIETPPFARSQIVAALASPGPLEQVDTQTHFWVTPPEHDWPAARVEDYLQGHPFGEIEVTSIHEAYPGHHVQAIHGRGAHSLVRRLLWPATYGEGWAHYCEQMVVDEGYGDDTVRLFQRQDALLRAARAWLDVGVHVFGMSYEDAVRYYETEAWLTHEDAVIEARRVALNPATVYVYTYGKLQFLRLRNLVVDHPTDPAHRVTLGAFHDALMDFGAAPIPQVARILYGVDLGGLARAEAPPH